MGAWSVGSRMQSPEQAAANATPPVPSWITARVEHRVLAQTLITRGDVRPQSAIEVAVPASVEGVPVVTNIGVQIGAAVVEGTRLVEVSGRPVFVLQGEVPVFRSLRPGMTGADVAQLQHALTRLGFTPETDGVFGEATKAAVAAFYEQAGYAPLPTSPTEAADRAAAEQALSDAEAALADAMAAAGANGGPSASALAQAQAGLAQAERALELAEADRTTQVGLAQSAVDLAVRERDRVAADPDSPQAERDQAQLAVDQAQGQLDHTRRSTLDAVESAKEAVWIAALTLNELEAGGGAGQAQVHRATLARDRAAAALTALIAASGPTVDLGEVVFVPTMPARVQQVVAGLGPLEPDATSLATLAAGDLVVSMTLRPDDAGLVRVGMPVVLLDELSNTTYPATVTTVSDTPVATAEGDVGVPVTLTPDDPLPDALAGANVRVTVTAASTETETLVVPVAAVSSAADGTTYVSLLAEDATAADEPTTVPVTTGLSADGFVSVSPVTAGTLAEGDRVVVGR